MPTPLALIPAFAALLLAAHSLWPWLRLPDLPLLRWPLTVGLSLGGLTLLMLAVLLLGLPLWGGALVAVLLAVLSLGWWRNRARPRTQLALPDWSFGEWGVALALLLLLVVVLGQATYYPFIGDDEISRYAYHARLVYEAGALPPDLRGYPQWLPFLYAYSFLVSGGLHEQFAKLLPVLVSAATVAATAALALRWAGKRRAAWAAALVLAATPNFILWAPQGYVDIPSALYVVLGACAVDVWRERRDWRWAALTGLLTGLAIWTKQAGFAMLPTLGLLYAWAILDDWRNQRSIWPAAAHGLLTLAVALAVAAPWYARNFLIDGPAGVLPTPGDYYTALATRQPLGLIPFLSNFTDFGWATSLAFLAGLAWAVVRIRRRTTVTALLWAVPYTLLWWSSFSYDARFLLTVLPFYAILAGLLVADLPTDTTTLEPRQVGVYIAILSLAVAGLGIVQARPGGLVQWVTNPTATYGDRLTRAKADLWPMVDHLATSIPTDAALVSMDGRLSYYFPDRDINVTYPQTLAELESYDYLIIGSWWTTAYAGFGIDDTEVYRELDALYAGQPSVFTIVYGAPAGILHLATINPP